MVKLHNIISPPSPSRVDGTHTVKVADFGLSRDLFNAEYYKGDQKAPLPVRWMAVESLRDLKFSVKTDVVGIFMYMLCQLPSCYVGITSFQKVYD